MRRGKIVPNIFPPDSHQLRAPPTFSIIKMKRGKKKKAVRVGSKTEQILYGSFEVIREGGERDKHQSK